MVLSRLIGIRLLTSTVLRNQIIVFLPVRFRVRLPDLPGTFRDVHKTTAPMYASGTPSGTLPGASGTAVKQKSASQPSGQLPVSFWSASGFLPEASGTRLN